MDKAPCSKCGVLTLPQTSQNFHSVCATCNRTETRLDLKSTSTLFRWVKVIVYIQIAVVIASLVSTYFEYQMLFRLNVGLYASHQHAVAAAEASDLRQLIIHYASLAVFFMSSIVILRWIFRSKQNSIFMGSLETAFSPGWSVGWFFVPFASLWKPYLAMKELWKTSHSVSDWKNVAVPSIVAWWWFFWIALSALAQFSVRYGQKAKNFDELIINNMIGQATNIVHIVLAVITLSMMMKIFNAQQALVKAKE